MNWEIWVCAITFLIISTGLGVLGTLYTRCNTLKGVVYQEEPLYSGTCQTVMVATTQCLNSSLCDLISRDGTQCSFHTAVDRNVTCDTKGMFNGTVSKAKFRSCNCTLITDGWVRSGPFYLYQPNGTYLCSEGQNNIKLIQQQQGLRNGFDTPLKHTVDVCMSHGGIMAEFYTIDELNYALAYVTGDIFVGGHFLNGKYVWKTTNQEIEASLWVPGQPVDFEDAPCVQIWHSNGGIDDFWPNQYRPILCQKLRVVAIKVNFITPN